MYSKPAAQYITSLRVSRRLKIAAIQSSRERDVVRLFTTSNAHGDDGERRVSINEGLTGLQDILATSRGSFLSMFSTAPHSVSFLRKASKAEVKSIVGFAA